MATEPPPKRCRSTALATDEALDALDEPWAHLAEHKVGTPTVALRCNPERVTIEVRLIGSRRETASAFTIRRIQHEEQRGYDFWTCTTSWELHAYKHFFVYVNGKGVEGKVAIKPGDTIGVNVKESLLMHEGSRLRSVEEAIGLWPADIWSRASIRAGLRKAGPCWVFVPNTDHDAAQSRLLACCTGLDLRGVRPGHGLPARRPFADIINHAEKLGVTHGHVAATGLKREPAREAGLTRKHPSSPPATIAKAGWQVVKRARGPH